MKQLIWSVRLNFFNTIQGNIEKKNIKIIWIFSLVIFVTVFLMTMGNAYFYETALESRQLELLESEYQDSRDTVVIKSAKIKIIKQHKIDAFYAWLLSSFLISTVLSIIIAFWFNFLLHKLHTRLLGIASGIKIEEEEEEEEEEDFYEFEQIYKDIRKNKRDLIKAQEFSLHERARLSSDNSRFEREISSLQKVVILGEINTIITSSKTAGDLCNRTFDYLASIFNMQMGALYAKDSTKNTLVLAGSYAKNSKFIQDTLDIDTTLAGACYMRQHEKVVSYETDMVLCELNIIPLLYQSTTIAIVELYFTSPLLPHERELLTNILSPFAVNLKIQLDTEVQMQLQEKVFGDIFDLTLEGMIIVDSDLNILKYNQVIQSLFPAITTNRHLGRFFEEEEEEELIAYVHKLQSGFKSDMTSTVVHNGRFYRIGVRQIYYKDYDNLLLIFSDQTDLLEAERFIEENVIFTQTNAYGIITRASEAFCKISGYEKNELIGKPHNIVRHPDMDSSVFHDMWGVLHSGNTFRAKIKNRKKDGGYYWVDSTISPIIQNKNIVGYRSVRHDITHEHDLEEFGVASV